MGWYQVFDFLTNDLEWGFLCKDLLQRVKSASHSYQGDETSVISARAFQGGETSVISARV